MGGRFVGVAARQHPDLTETSPDTDHRSVTSATRVVVLSLLAADGVVCVVVATMFLQVRLGSIPFPISAPLAGLVNLALVWVGLQWTSSPRLAAISLWAWLLTIALLTLGGPGGDILFGGPGFADYGVLGLLVLGAAPPALLIWRRRTAG